jgi:hypothetical protein
MDNKTCLEFNVGWLVTNFVDNATYQTKVHVIAAWFASQASMWLLARATGSK